MKKGILQISFIILMLSIVFISGARAVTTACNGSQADCQAKVNAAADGDVITIPDGDFTWTGDLTVDLSAGAGKALTIKGLNACTLDVNGRPTSCPTSISGAGAFYVIGKLGKAWRISSMTLNGGMSFKARGNSRNWRIDHIYFNAPTGAGGSSSRIVWAGGSGGTQTASWGLIDHCTVYNSSAMFLHIRANNSDGGNYEWSLGAELGTANAVYIEDCTFITPTYNFYGGFLTDCEAGSFVIRNNILGNNWVSSHDAIVNGFRGCKKAEVYNNTFANVAGSGLSIVRGGAQVMFSNTMTNTPSGSAIEVHLYRTYQATTSEPWNTLCGSTSGTAYLNTTTTYPQNCTGGTGCVNKDGSGPNGYPCRDQLGVEGNGTQTIQPALYWNNKAAGSYFEPHVRSGVAYYTKGVNYCSNASTDKPTTCNGSAVTYTPYTYPHPLSITESMPAPPSNVRIIQ